MRTDDERSPKPDLLCYERGCRRNLRWGRCRPEVLGVPVCLVLGNRHPALSPVGGPR